MKKILLAVISILLLLTLTIFIFIPSKIVIAESNYVYTTAIGFDSCLHHPEKWKQWWPGSPGPAGTDSSFVHDQYTYALSELYSDGAAITISSGNNSYQSRIRTIFKIRDTILAEWGVELQAGNNPFTRLSNYLAAGKLKKSMQVVFDSLCHYAAKTENIYGYPIERTTFTEVTLIAFRLNTAIYPTTETIYKGVNQLKQYLVSQGAVEKYYPMMDTKRVDSSHYETMIAISIDKNIPANKDYFISQMVPMKDRFLATEVTGGPASIEKARWAIEKYMEDHTLPAPGRPFEILVTDRSKVADTASWKTKIFYPSM
jgi:hypothetical protein